MAPRKKLLLAALITVAAALSACGKRAGAPAAGPSACRVSSECAPGWVCLAGRCADASHGAAFTNTQNAVTPDKVRREVEQKLAAPEKKLDQINAGSE